MPQVQQVQGAGQQGDRGPTVVGLPPRLLGAPPGRARFTWSRWSRSPEQGRQSSTQGVKAPAAGVARCAASAASRSPWAFSAFPRRGSVPRSNMVCSRRASARPSSIAQDLAYPMVIRGARPSWRPSKTKALAPPAVIRSPNPGAPPSHKKDSCSRVATSATRIYPTVNLSCARKSSVVSFSCSCRHRVAGFGNLGSRESTFRWLDDMTKTN